MTNWDEIRTAYHVARMGTVSGAAEALGVHHATVIRHIDALEKRLGVKLFHRHPRGYTPTEEGQELRRVAQATDDQFQQLSGRIRGRGSDVTGDLVVTSLVNLAPFMVRALAGFQRKHPDVTVRYLTDDRLFRLEYGEAHVALRAGAVPQDPDNVVQPFAQMRIGLYASTSYIDRNGRPASLDDLGDHLFVAHDNPDNRAPHQKWIKENIPYARVRFRCTDSRVMQRAVLDGAGLGFLPETEATHYPDLVQVAPPQDDWCTPMWLVTHVDLHRTAKVQAFLNHLKAFAEDL